MRKTLNFKQNQMIRLLLIMGLFLTSCNSNKSWTCDGDCENGKGEKVWRDGGVERGTWSSGQLHGDGFQSFGTKSEFSGDHYEGAFINGLYFGQGTYYDLSEDSKYVGQWVFGKPEGKGRGTFGSKSKYPNRYYDGEWKDGKRHGHGIKFWGEAGEHTNDRYEGEWKNDDMSGLGRYDWANGNYYEGTWLNGNQHGEGKFVLENGDVFEGVWVDGYCEELAALLGLN